MGSLLHAGAEAPALGRRGACALPLPELPLPRWGGREEGAELSNAGLGDRQRAEGRRRTRVDAEPGARGVPQAERQREQFFCILGFLTRFC